MLLDFYHLYYYFVLTKFQKAVMKQGTTTRRKEKSIEILQGQTGFGYDAIFRPYMASSKRVGPILMQLMDAGVGHRCLCTETPPTP
jgi:hypothetical protein